MLPPSILRRTLQDAERRKIYDTFGTDLGARAYPEWGWDGMGWVGEWIHQCPPFSVTGAGLPWPVTGEERPELEVWTIGINTLLSPLGGFAM